MIKTVNKQRGLSLFETMLAVMLIGGVIAVIMNVESGSKSSDNTTILAQDISLLLNKSLEKTESDQNTSISYDISTDEKITEIASYLDISTTFIDSLIGRGLKKYSLKTSTGDKDSGDMGSGGKSGHDCDFLDVIITNNSSYTWIYDSQLSYYSDSKGQIYSKGFSDPENISTPLLPNQTIRITFGSGKVTQYLYFKSAGGGDIIGFYLHKEDGNPSAFMGDDAKVETHIQQGMNFTRHGKKDNDGQCRSDTSNKDDANGFAYFVIFDPRSKITTVDMTLANTKQAKMIASKTYDLIASERLDQLDLISTKPIDMTINNQSVQYVLNQKCPPGELNPDSNGMNYETPNPLCAYSDDDRTVDNYA